MKKSHCHCGQISYVPCLVTVYVLTPQKAQKDSGSFIFGPFLTLLYMPLFLDGISVLFLWDSQVAQ